ncbi:GDSL esterase/lipase EXL3, partial [Striga hermonthica]
EKLGIKPVLPAYLDPNLQDEDILTGVSFASGASGYDPITSKLTSTISLSDQIEMFKEYTTRLKKIVGEEKSSQIVRESLIALITGSNDLTFTYFLTLERRTHYDIPSYIDLLLNFAITFIEELYDLGVRRIGIFGLPPIGWMPSQRTLWGGLKRKPVNEYNQIAELFNTKLSDELGSLNKQYPEAKIIYVDVYNPALDIIQNPKKYGFEIADKGCCGTGLFEVGFLCKSACGNRPTAPPPSPSIPPPPEPSNMPPTNIQAGYPPPPAGLCAALSSAFLRLGSHSRLLRQHHHIGDVELIGNLPEKSSTL